MAGMLEGGVRPAPARLARLARAAALAARLLAADRAEAADPDLVVLRNGDRRPVYDSYDSKPPAGSSGTNVFGITLLVGWTF